MSNRADRSIRVDSDDELRAYLTAFSITEDNLPDLTDDHAAEIQGRDVQGQPIHILVERSGDTSPTAASRFGVPITGSLDEIMVRAVAFSTENPPHHPGTVARFPMPSNRFSGCVEVPLAVIAGDNGLPGLYAPPRVAVLEWRTAEPRGIGEFPGFSPDAWPPPRLGDWPPPGIRDLPSDVISGSVARLSGCLGRLINHALGIGPATPPSDVADAITLFARLDVPAMLPYYERMSPDFGRMLNSSRNAESGA